MCGRYSDRYLSLDGIYILKIKKKKIELRPELLLNCVCSITSKKKKKTVCVVGKWRLWRRGKLGTQPTQCYSLGSVWCSESLAGIYCVGLGFLTLSPCSSSALLSVPSVSFSVPYFLFVWLLFLPLNYSSNSYSSSLCLFLRKI